MQKNTFLTTTTLLLLALISISNVAWSQEKITLRGILEDTKEHYPLLRQEKVLDASLENIKQTLYYAYIPQVSINGNVRYQSHVPSIALKMKEPGAGDDTSLDPFVEKMMGRIVVPNIPKLQYQTYAQVTQLIWGGGRVKSGGEVARAAIAEQTARMKADYEKVEDAVTELYFALLMLDAQDKLQETYLTEINRQKAKAENGLNNGVVSLNDIDEIELERLKAEQQRATIKDGRATLLRTIGYYTGKNYNPESTEAVVPEIPMISLERAEDRGLGHIDQRAGKREERYAPGRMTHLLLDAKLQSAKATYEMSVADMMPQVALFARGGYGRPGLDFFSDKSQPFFVYGLTFSWDFGNLYHLNAKRRDLHNSEEMIRIGREAFEINTRAKVEKLRGEARRYRTLVDRDEEIIATYQRIADRANLMEEAGTMTAPDRLRKVGELNGALRTRDVHKVQLLRALYMAERELGAFGAK